MAGFSGENYVRLEVVYVDEHLMELKATVKNDGWGGVASTFTTADQVASFAKQLSNFANHPVGQVPFEIGSQESIGLIGLKFYIIDKARHVRCQVRLATDSSRESVSRLSIEVETEPSFVERFARQLSVLAEAQAGQATLITE